jgi:hypothetical protein
MRKVGKPTMYMKCNETNTNYKKSKQTWADHAQTNKEQTQRKSKMVYVIDVIIIKKRVTKKEVFLSPRSPYSLRTLGYCP